jgi:hypothetical protein
MAGSAGLFVARTNHMLRPGVRHAVHKLDDGIKLQAWHAAVSA